MNTRSKYFIQWWMETLTYSAITVVTGRTTVYCSTPSLHLKSKTLQRTDHVYPPGDTSTYRDRSNKHFHIMYSVLQHEQNGLDIPNEQWGVWLSTLGQTLVQREKVRFWTKRNTTHRNVDELLTRANWKRKSPFCLDMLFIHKMNIETKSVALWKMFHSPSF